jgi:mono/diheme cytochrome c family protein
MREKWARRIALLTGGLVLTLAVIFARSQNPPERSPPARAPEVAPSAASIAPAVDAALVESGRRVYAEQGCVRCHAIAGRGNPRSPLDGLGARLGAAEIRRWITPHQEPAASSDSFQARHADRTLTEPQREALLVYLRSLRDGARAP